MINRAEGALKTNKYFRVVDFSKIQGLESLWEVCLNSLSYKARELCQQLLINLFLRQTTPTNKALIQQFVDKCMQNITSDGVVNFLSTFLDRYEGIKEIRVD